ncbi:D-sedoheptulose-7-phosphate isomerase [Tepidimicrobium xylanilyticum]|uniref:D-sedoheptulose-7-phosphate isomerase n=1 Tax=Tepidimicrobium xylanilyticum TaxID=1123352 RepID=UPI00264D85AE|nr:SIS domain-containing protein [Tepidimicrobium xylanilyticum]GMG95462.1 phosphoheptose isomerase [Tepidimicrobium xylanilyticum]
MIDKSLIVNFLDETKNTSERCKSVLVEDIVKLADLFEKTFENGNRVIAFGNGGCAGVANIMAASFIGRFKSGKEGRPVLSLSSNADIITTLSNDYGFENIYKKQVEVYALKNDLVIGLSTSGNSVNVINGIEEAKAKGAYTVAITGESGGKLKEIVDFIIKIPSRQPTQIENVMAEINSILCKVLK